MTEIIFINRKPGEHLYAVMVRGRIVAVVRMVLKQMVMVTVRIVVGDRLHLAMRQMPNYQ